MTTIYAFHIDEDGEQGCTSAHAFHDIDECKLQMLLYVQERVEQWYEEIAEDECEIFASDNGETYQVEPLELTVTLTSLTLV